MPRALTPSTGVFTPTSKEDSIKHLFRREDGETLSFDSDLWLCVLDLALIGGWRPEGTMSPDEELERSANDGMRWQPLAYFLPRGQRIDRRDAREIARCSNAALADVPDQELTLRGRSFGRRNTLRSIRRAAEGTPVYPESAEAAVELLSGSPKVEAQALIAFLRKGVVTIHPA